MLNGLGSATLQEELFPVLIHLLQVLGQLVRLDVVYSERPPQELEAVDVVHGQDGGPLVLVAEEPEPLALSRVVVPDQIDVDDLSVLREHGQEISLGQVVGHPA